MRQREARARRYAAYLRRCSPRRRTAQLGGGRAGRGGEGWSTRLAARGRGGGRGAYIWRVRLLLSDWACGLSGCCCQLMRVLVSLPLLQQPRFRSPAASFSRTPFFNFRTCSESTSQKDWCLYPDYETAETVNQILAAFPVTPCSHYLQSLHSSSITSFLSPLPLSLSLCLSVSVSVPVPVSVSVSFSFSCASLYPLSLSLSLSGFSPSPSFSLSFSFVSFSLLSRLSLTSPDLHLGKARHRVREGVHEREKRARERERSVEVD